jgi:hypothetical protein
VTELSPPISAPSPETDKRIIQQLRSELEATDLALDRANFRLRRQAQTHALAIKQLTASCGHHCCQIEELTIDNDRLHAELHDERNLRMAAEAKLARASKE